MDRVFSLLFGMILSHVEIYELAAGISKRQWILCRNAVPLMIHAAVPYSFLPKTTRKYPAAYDAGWGLSTGRY